jgi:hypothetical protein
MFRFGSRRRCAPGSRQITVSPHGSASPASDYYLSPDVALNGSLHFCFDLVRMNLKQVSHLQNPVVGSGDDQAAVTARNRFGFN